MVDTFCNVDGELVPAADCPADKTYREAWRVVNGVVVYDRTSMEAIITRLIIEAMSVKILAGVTWKFNGGDTPHPLRITPSMRLFLDNTQAAIDHPTHPRPNVHNGEIFQDGVAFAIDDAGIIELALFAYSWGLKVSQKSQVFIAALSSKTDTQLKNYNIAGIDWSVAWDVADQNQGWSDNSLTQTP